MRTSITLAILGLLTLSQQVPIAAATKSVQIVMDFPADGTQTIDHTHSPVRVAADLVIHRPQGVSETVRLDELAGVDGDGRLVISVDVDDAENVEFLEIGRIQPATINVGRKRYVLAALSGEQFHLWAEVASDAIEVSNEDMSYIITFTPPLLSSYVHAQSVVGNLRQVGEILRIDTIRLNLESETLVGDEKSRFVSESIAALIEFGRSIPNDRAANLYILQQLIELDGDYSPSSSAVVGNWANIVFVAPVVEM